MTLMKPNVLTQSFCVILHVMNYVENHKCNLWCWLIAVAPLDHFWVFYSFLNNLLIRDTCYNAFHLDINYNSLPFIKFHLDSMAGI